jgi:hypothetical protein
MAKKVESVQIELSAVGAESIARETQRGLRMAQETMARSANDAGGLARMRTFYQTQSRMLSRNAVEQQTRDEMATRIKEMRRAADRANIAGTVNAKLFGDTSTTRAAVQEAGAAAGKTYHDGFIASMGSMFGRGSFATKTLKMLKASGPALAIGLGAKLFEHSTAAIAEAMNKARGEGGSAVGAIVGNLPLIGDVVHGFNNIVEAIGGANAEIARTKAMDEALAAVTQSRLETQRRITDQIKQHTEYMREQVLISRTALAPQATQETERLKAQQRRDREAIDDAEAQQKANALAARDKALAGMNAAAGQIGDSAEAQNFRRMNSKRIHEDYLKEVEQAERQAADKRSAQAVASATEQVKLDQDQSNRRMDWYKQNDAALAEIEHQARVERLRRLGLDAEAEQAVIEHARDRQIEALWDGVREKAKIDKSAESMLTERARAQEAELRAGAQSQIDVARQKSQQEAFDREQQQIAQREEAEKSLADRVQQWRIDAIEDEEQRRLAMINAQFDRERERLNELANSPGGFDPEQLSAAFSALEDARARALGGKDAAGGRAQDRGVSTVESRLLTGIAAAAKEDRTQKRMLAAAESTDKTNKRIADAATAIARVVGDLSVGVF